MFVKIGGVRQYLWPTVDQDGNVLDILVQSRRNANAARRFMVKLMKKRRGGAIGSHRTSDPDATCSPPPNTASRCTTASKPGTTSPAPPPCPTTS
ncbi:DDE-type integrase/transposase/recombinase [Streptomyces antimycoticus]